MRAVDVENALEAGDAKALREGIESLARLHRNEAMQRTSTAPQAAALFDDTAKVLTLLGEALDQQSGSKGWQLILKRAGRGRQPVPRHRANLTVWYRAKALERETTIEGKRWRAFEKLAENYGISESAARRAEKQYQYWIANQDKADGVQIPFVAKKLDKVDEA